MVGSIISAAQGMANSVSATLGLSEIPRTWVGAEAPTSRYPLGAGVDGPIGPAVDPRMMSSSYFNPTIDQLAPLIGRPVADVIAGLQSLGGTDIRNGDGPVTMDFVEGRVTYETDENGNVSQIAVEGGVIVDAEILKTDPIDKEDRVRKAEGKDPSGDKGILTLLTGLIGQTGTDAAEAVKNLGVPSIRVIGPNDVFTTDYVPGRANIYVDDKNIVTRIQIEGVADTDRGVLSPDAS